MNPPKKIAAFAPFGAWVVHHQLDAALAAALRLRNCDVQVVGCDGIFLNCHITGNPPNPEFCKMCASSGRQLFSAFHLPVTQLRGLLTEKDLQEARDWAKGVPVRDLPNAVFEGGELGKWVASEMYSYFRTGELDYSRKDVVLMNMSFLYNAAILQRAFTRFLDEFKPDWVFSYHSVHMYYRVVFELARKRGINVLVHERGWIDDSFLLLKNNTAYTYTSRFEACEAWEKSPLTLNELQEVKQFFQDRETGKNTNFMPMYTFTSNDLSVRRALRIPPDARIVAVFGSGDWEVGMFRDHGYMTFTSQIEWLKKTAEICARNNAYLVIRHHPLIAGTTGYPSGKAFLKKLFQYNRDIAKHVRVIMPSEKVTSYSVLWNADVAITLFSTTAAEAIVRGVSSLSLSQSLFEPMGVGAVRSLEDYEGAIQQSLQKTEQFSLEDLRRAYRYVHTLYFKLNHRFRSFGMRETYTPDIRIKSLDELQEGKDATLDQVCNHILNDTPLYVMPSDSKEERLQQLETEFLQKEFDQIRQRRAQIKQQAVLDSRPVEPLVSVVRLSDLSVNKDPESSFSKTIQVSRHQNFEWLDAVTGELKNPQEWVAALIKAVNQARGEFVYFGTDEIHVDASLISTAIDFLESSGNREFSGVAWGAWICDGDGLPAQELFTKQQPHTDHSAMVDRVPDMTNPSRMISLFVFRASVLRQWLSELQKKSVSDTFSELSLRIYQETLGGSSSLKVELMQVPMVTFYPAMDVVALVRQGRELLDRGQPKEALALFDQVKRVGKEVPQLEEFRTQAKEALARSWEKRLSTLPTMV
jgi:hypothetical protein